MHLKRFFTPGLAINSYLICDDKTRRAAIIDPTRQTEIFLAYALQNNIQITDIIETHVHGDFLSGAPELKAALEGKATIHCSGMGGPDWIPTYADRIVMDCDEVSLGGVRLQAWHAPGHTPEHLVWLVFDERRSLSIPEMAFTGDLLFIGSVGRPDLLTYRKEGDLSEQLYNTLFMTIKSLPDFLIILPAHGAGSPCGKDIGTQESSTLGYERRCSPAMQLEDFSIWRKKLYDEMPAPPKYFQRMKTLNVTNDYKRKTLCQEPPLLLTKEQVKEHLPSTLIVDVRNPLSFAEKHVKGSINVPMSPSFALWGAIALPENQRFIIVVNKLKDAYDVVQALHLVGLDEVFGVYDASTWNVDEQDPLFESSPTIDVKTLHSKQNSIFIVDVRTPSEWQSGHIAGSYHCELMQLPDGLEEIVKKQEAAIICHSGNRGSIVASLLKKMGCARVYNVRGGIHAWQKAGFPVTT